MKISLAHCYIANKHTISKTIDNVVSLKKKCIVFQKSLKKDIDMSEN